MDGLLASSGLSVKPSSQSPAVDIVLFCLFTEYQTWEGPKIPSGPMLPHFPEAQVGRRLMKCTWELKHRQEWTLPTLCNPQPRAVSILLLFLNLGLLLFPCSCQPLMTSTESKHPCKGFISSLSGTHKCWNSCACPAPSLTSLPCLCFCQKLSVISFRHGREKG